MSNRGFLLGCEFIINHKAGLLGLPPLHSFVRQTFGVDLHINRALLGPGDGREIQRPRLLPYTSAGLGNDLISKTNEGKE